MMNLLKQAAVSWAIWFVFGKQPDWGKADQVRMFLVRNQWMIVWLVDLLNLRITTNFNRVYTEVIGNKILFDVFFESAILLWTNPSALIANMISNTVNPILLIERDPAFLGKIRAGIQQRRAARQGTAEEIAAAEAPAAVAATAEVTTVLVKLASVVAGLRS